MNKNTLILASASPRRREILASAGYEFIVLPSNAKESTGGLEPSELVVANARLKAEDIAGTEEAKGFAVLGADTVVCLDGEILGKPKDANDAKRMLSMLSGRDHAVLTGYCIISPDGRTTSGVCSTKVKFRTLSIAEIDAYIATGEPFDKAGAYGIQERGSMLVDRVDGDFYNVVGLPISRIALELKQFGITPEIREGETLDIIARLEKWFEIHCDDDWEHDERVTICNLDNPGWNVRIDLADTLLEDIEFKRIKFGDPENRKNQWLDCFKQGNIFNGLGSWDMLGRIILEFLTWAEENTDTTPWDDEVAELFRKCGECEARICENDENNSEVIHELRDIFRKIEDIPNEHNKKKDLFDRFYSVWNKVVR